MRRGAELELSWPVEPRGSGFRVFTEDIDIDNGAEDDVASARVAPLDFEFCALAQGADGGVRWVLCDLVWSEEV